LCGLGICGALGEAADAGQDFLGALGPHKGFWIDIVRVKELINGALELALASFLEIDVLALQEQGVKQGDGISGFIQGNAIPFSERRRLPDLVTENVQRRVESRTWDPRWRNELALTREPEYFADATQIPAGTQGRFFHIGVHNRHRRKTAMNCCVYLEKAAALDPAAKILVKTVEFKWEGYMLPNAHIQPGTVRKFDAFWIQHDQPNQVKFNMFCDASYFYPQIEGPGRYELTYLVMADNFPPTRRSFMLTLNSLLNDTSLEPMPFIKSDTNK